jgi:S1-C subfamily serine protease
MYELPKLKAPKLKGLFKPSVYFKGNLRLAAIVISISIFFGFLAGAAASGFFYLQIKDYINKLNISSPAIGGEIFNGYTPQTSQEQAIIKAVKKVSPAVVSIIISKDMPVYEEYYENPFKGYEKFFGPMPEFNIPKYRQKGTQRKEIGGGTGFIVSKDGLILTNKHVVLDKNAEYTVLTNDGRKFSAKVLAKDPVQDLAVIKIEGEKTVDGKGEVVLKPFPTVTLGDSDKLQIGQTVIAIGNALGEFRNTVSVGVVSGLGRKITASGGDFVETLEDVIQTDAAINKGNSGGPLLNLKGEVVGVNTAMALQAQSIGFTVPINKAKRDIRQVRESGKIVYPFLGVRYVLINNDIKKKKNLSVDYGALVVKGNKSEPAIMPGSAAEKAGLKEGDIILEFNNKRITTKNSLSKIIAKYNPGDKINLKILRNNEEKTVGIILGKRSE